jgi:hypothetical protein|tara:strand:- start:295 stop:402 length:108 start_codon:yes stop_codon:yes gene_type:complete
MTTTIVIVVTLVGAVIVALAFSDGNAWSEWDDDDE